MKHNPYYLSSFLVDPNCAGNKTDMIYVFRTGLQRLLTAMIGILCADLMPHKIEPGFSGRFLRAFEYPTLGELGEFAIWLTKHPSSPEIDPLMQLFKKDKKRGWLSKMITFRNKWAHPKEQTPDEIVESAIRLKEEMPDFSKLGYIEMNPETSISWCVNQGRLNLSPFFWKNGKNLEVFSSINRENHLIGSDTTQCPHQNQFDRIWTELRQRDRGLANPSIDEFHLRIHQLADAEKNKDNAPWWLKKAMKGHSIGILITHRLFNGIRSHCKKYWPNASLLDLELSRGNTPFSAMATALGLFRPPTLTGFASCIDADHQIIIFLDAENVSTRDMGHILFWMADLNELGLLANLRIFISRKKELLAHDFPELESDMSDEMDGLLAYPPGKESKTLTDCLWTDDLKKSWFPI